MKPSVSLAVIPVLLLLPTISCSAEGPDGSAANPYVVPEVAFAVAIDGVLDDPPWNAALRLELPYETSPGENTEPPVRTEILLASSTTHLYAAFVAEDPDPRAICANITDRDHMFDDDRVSLILDTYNDHRRGYMFFCNPYGIQGDALDSSGMGAGDPAWDAIWDSDGRITPEGFVVEMAIPFSSLRFQRTDGPQVWGIGIGRKYSRDFDYRMSLTPRDRDETCYLCQVAKFSGFAGATPGRNIEIDPTLSLISPQGTAQFNNYPFSSGRRDEFGVTGRWGITPNLVLSGTANPDFSQVEADAFQLDVNTQFALYYEEKRPFFLEGMELFDLRLSPVYTRSVADPRWGLKLTGKEGSNALGAFVVRDEVTNLILPGSEGSEPASLDSETTGAVLRYRMDLASASTVGVIATSREGDGYHNRLAGVDGNLRLTPSDRIEFEVLKSRTLYPELLAKEHDQPLDEFDGSAYDFEYNHDSSTYDWWLAYRQIEQGFRSDMGFRTQADFRQARTGWSRTWRAEAGHWFTDLNAGFGYVHSEEPDEDMFGSELLNSFADAWFNYAGPLRSSLDLYGVYGRRTYGGEEYDNRYVWASVGLWPTGSTMVQVEGTIGDAVDIENVRQADAVQLEPTISFKLGRQVDVLLSHSYERLDVEEGWLYRTHISYVRAGYQFTKRAFVRAIVQHAHYHFNADLYPADWNSVFRYLATQILFSYKINPQTVLYVGYSDDHLGNQHIDLRQDGRTFFAKIGYAFVL